MTDRHPPTTESAAVADAVVRILRGLTGRGATRAKTVIQDDVVMVVMYDSLTAGERELVDRGYERDVLSLRHAYQSAMRKEVTRAVESILGREVVAFMSNNHTDPDCSIEVFLLGEDLEDPPSADLD